MTLVPKVSIARTFGERDTGITPRLPAEGNESDKRADQPVPETIAKRGRSQQADQNIGVKLS